MWHITLLLLTHSGVTVVNCKFIYIYTTVICFIEAQDFIKDLGGSFHKNNYKLLQHNFRLLLFYVSLN